MTTPLSAIATRPATSMLSHQRRLIGAAGVVLLLLLASCSGDNVSQTERVVPPTAVPAPAGLGPGGEALTLEVIDGGSATGLVITDHRGFAVYGVAGEAAEGKPTCFGDCLDIWIPLSPRDLAVSERLDADLFEIYIRPEGFEQVVYASVPLYTWSGDTEVGITGGAGVAGTWFALTQTAGFIE